VNEDVTAFTEIWDAGGIDPSDLLPAGGRIGAPEDMAGIAIFLASAAAAYINGAVIPVDGGLSLR